MRLALGIEYDGSAFRGFQFQRNAPSVQAALEDALSSVAAAPIRVTAAGRTDAGVHATGQVVGFETSADRPLGAWLRGTNALTPAAVKVRWARTVDDAFHARYLAVARRYQYLFHDGGGRSGADQPEPGAAVVHADPGQASPLTRGYVTPSRALDADAMHRAAQGLLGEHDFTTYRAAGCQSLSAHRCVHRIAVLRVGPLVVLDITANAFLLHMVRNIAGALQRVGEGAAPEAWPVRALAGRDRALIGRTAPAAGLYLVDVRYPGYDLPPGQPPALLRAVGGLDRF